MLRGERGTGEYVFTGLPSYSEASKAAAGFQVASCPWLCNDRCQGSVQAERESLFMRQSTVAFERISCISCSRCSHIGNLVRYFLLASYLAVTRPVCLGVACGVLKIEFFGRFCGYSCAMHGPTVNTCSASVRDATGRNAHIFHCEANSNPEVFFLRSHAEWRSVLSRCLRCLEIGNSMHELHVADSLHDEG